VTGPIGFQGATGPYNTPSFSNVTISFTQLATNPYNIETEYSATTLPVTQKIIIQGYQCTTSGDVIGLLEVYPTKNLAYSTSNWTVAMTAIGTVSSSNTSYTVYYYGLT